MMNTTTKDRVYEFSKGDRCDKCNAEAWIFAVKNGFDLLFCNHHGQANVIKLEEQGFRIEVRTKE
jgi:hypothetical protein